jgi:hypothetical protein
MVVLLNFAGKTADWFDPFGESDHCIDRLID